MRFRASAVGVIGWFMIGENMLAKSHMIGNHELFFFEQVNFVPHLIFISPNPTKNNEGDSQ
jgi:hypothetical protein